MSCIRKVRFSGSIAALALATLAAVPAAAQTGLLFDDDFSTGDLSRYNDFFRWGGSGDLPGPGHGAGNVVTIEGPDGRRVNALRFEYRGTADGASGDAAHWSELRFHLTESAHEHRRRDGDSDVAHQELWFRYSMRIPANYYHRRAGRASNNKGFLTLWKNAYQGALVHMRTEWWPLERGDGLSRLTLVHRSSGSHNRKLSFREADFRIDARSESEGTAFAFLPSERAQWVDYAFRFRVSSARGAKDGLFELYRNGKLSRAWYGLEVWPRDGNPQHAGFDRGYILGYHNSAYEQTTTFYITDFKVGTTAESIGLSTDGKRRPEPPVLLLGD